MEKRIYKKLIKNCVIIYDYKTIFLDKNSQIKSGTKIYENNHIINSGIGEKCIVLPNNFINNCLIKNNVEINNSFIENSEINNNTKIGPYVHFRGKTIIGKNCKIGNFCEIKNSTIGDNCKIAHLSYVGDSVVGDNCNIGCGVVFANYDGKIKNNIIVGKNVFIGCNSILIAPLTIADNTYICAGSVVTQDTKPFDFVIGRVKAEYKSNKAIGRYLA